jgi:eukaryotic-like serine/threonine-protein kinase
MESSVRAHRTRFGDFDVDLRSGEVYKHGIRLKLQGQPYQVLALLLKQPGELVTREELRQSLWPEDTFVDFDTGLNTAIKKLRDVLGDSADEPRYIETLPRRGYRFIAVVENGAPPASPATEEHRESVLPSGPAPKLPNKRRIAVAAGVAAFLFVAVLVTWRMLATRPALKVTDVILLANFVNRTGDPVFDNSLDKALQVKLTESPFLSLLPETDVRATLGMMRHNPDDRVTQDLGIEICKRQGLKAVVVPEIDAVGSTYLITLDAIDVQSGKSIARSHEQATNKDQVVAALGKAGSQLRLELGESLRSLEKYDIPLDLATTSSLEALQAYRTGQSLMRSGKQNDAIELFKRAVELDPKFCSAYAALGTAYFSISNDQAAWKSFTQAYELKDGRLTQEENFQTTALYHAYVTGNLEKELAVLLLYQQAYPRSVFAANRLGISYMTLGRGDEGLQQFMWAIKHSPVPSAQYYSNASQALVSLGRFEEAKNLLNEWQQKGSLNTFERDALYRIAFFENDSSTMERLAGQFPPDDVHWRTLQMHLAFLRGDLSKFRSLSDALISQQRNAGQMENVAGQLATRGQLESFLGNDDVSTKMCRQAVELGQDTIDELWHCGEVFADAGKVAQAEALAVKLNRIGPEDTIAQQVYLPLVRSAVERKRGNVTQALDLLAQSKLHDFTLDQYYQRAQSYLAAGDPRKAVAELETLLGHRGWWTWAVYAPLAHLGLARAYAMQGDTDKAKANYQDFLTLWKDADPTIPIYTQAKTEYAKLQ